MNCPHCAHRPVTYRLGLGKAIHIADELAAQVQRPSIQAKEDQ